MSEVEQDQQYMRRALALAARARGRTSPNPMVGAVVVRGQEVVGQGYHCRAGAEHAEVVALRQAGRRARGATLHVNLEPCNHTGRTGPCTRGIIAAGVRRVVVGMRDPNPRVNGKGIRALRRAGLEVSAGVLEDRCQELNEGFIRYITEGRPLVTFKAAVTLDGRTAARTGDARWVTGEQARRQGHRMRDHNDAIAVGVGTVLCDDPTLTCRDIRGGRDPVRVVMDSRLRTPPSARVVAAAARSKAPTLIFTTERAAKNRERALTKAGARVLRIPGDGRRVAIPAMLQALAREQLTSLLLEGGPGLAGGFWQEELVDRVVVFVAPKVLADPRGLPLVLGRGVDAMKDATTLQQVKVRRLGDDVMISGRVRPKG